MIPYLPSNYKKINCNNFLLWCSSHEIPESINFVREIILMALGSLRKTLEFCPKRQIHTCCYYSNEEAHVSLNRNIPPSMAMAPFASETDALVIIQSVIADSRNGQSARMRKIVTHELSHQFILEITSSTKILGDDNINRRIPAWLDEGFAEVASKMVNDCADELEEVAKEFQRVKMPFTFRELNNHLDNLWSEQRRRAFVQTIGGVYLLVNQASLKGVFQNLEEIKDRFRDDQKCLPEIFVA